MAMALHFETWGEGVPLLALHGFTGGAAAWSGLAADLDDIWVVAVDLPGHGRSPAPPPPPNALPATARALVDVLDRLGIQRAALLGYSLGGRLALHLALAAPDRVGALILESATAGIEDPSERTRRAAEDEALAAEIERTGLDSFVSRWESQPLFASQASLPDRVLALQRQRRLGHDPHGLAAALRGLGQGACPPVWERLARLRMPALVVAGALDPCYVGLGKRIQRSLSQARLTVVEDAGHTVHLERPRAFADLVTAFLTPAVARRSPAAGPRP